MKPMELSSDVLYIINTLNSFGYRADVVGGAVRDHLLGKPSYDFDITTSAHPDEVKSVFSGCRIVDTGIKHGTVTLVLDGGAYEITTWRVDGDYLDNRHPESIEFTRSLDEDLARRDFTVNAICYNPNDGYTDLFGGLADLDAGIIRAVGDPDRRFKEDALRIMRGVRFSATLGFSLEGATERAASDLRELVSFVSEERQYSELKKTLSAPCAYLALTKYSDIILTVLKELTGLRLPAEQAFNSADYLTRLIAIFYLNCERPKTAFSSAMHRLKTDNLTRISGERALGALDELLPDTRYNCLRLLNMLGVETASLAVEVGILVGKYSVDTRENMREAISSGIPYTPSGLKLNGNDLSALGIKGAEIGSSISLLLDAVMRGECINDKKALTDHITRCQKSH